MKKDKKPKLPDPLPATPDGHIDLTAIQSMRELSGFINYITEYEELEAQRKANPKTRDDQ